MNAAGLRSFDPRGLLCCASQSSSTIQASTLRAGRMTRSQIALVFYPSSRGLRAAPRNHAVSIRTHQPRYPLRGGALRRPSRDRTRGTRETTSRVSRRAGSRRFEHHAFGQHAGGRIPPERNQEFAGERDDADAA